MKTITIKIDKNYKLETTSEDKWLTVDLEEAVQYGSSSCLKIKVEFNSGKEIEDFKAGKKLNLEVAEDKTSVENDVLVIKHPWTVDQTLGQKTTDVAEKAGKKAKEAGGKAKETSKKATEATGKSVENTGKRMQDWPAWVYPIIVVGLILLGGIIYWIFKKK